jgi:hypothetical protein
MRRNQFSDGLRRYRDQIYDEYKKKGCDQGHEFVHTEEGQPFAHRLGREMNNQFNGAESYSHMAPVIINPGNENRHKSTTASLNLLKSIVSAS